MVKSMDQTARDSKRVTYRLNFPADLSPDHVVTWLRSISGTLRGGRMHLTGLPTLAFEVFATNKGIVHRLKVPYGHEQFVISKLRLAGINAVREEEFEDRNWTTGVELGLKNSGRQLRIFNTGDVSAAILADMQALEPDQAVIMQWVVSPASPRKLPIQGEAMSSETDISIFTRNGEATNDEVADRRKKMEEPNFITVLRVASFARTKSTAKGLTERIRMSLGALRGPTVRFQRRIVTQATLRERIRKASGAVVFPMQLSAPELSAVIAWPMGNPFVAGLAPTMTRHMPAVASIPNDGRVLGTATFPGAEKPVAVAYKHTVRHTYVLGPSGVGKTTLLANMMAQDMERGHGIILIEGKGDLFEEALERIPTKRINDVIILDVNDSERPVGFNILDQGNSRTSIDELSTLIGIMYADASKSLHAPQVLYHMLHALAEIPGHTFIDLPVLLANHSNTDVNSEWQDWLIRSLKSKDIRLFMQRFMNMKQAERDRMAGPVYNRTWEFTSRPEIKNIMGQRKSSFKMVDAIRDNKIVLVNLNGTRVGQQTASIAGTLLVNAVWQAVRQVQARIPNFLYLDEFQDFTNLPVGVEAMLAKARSSNLGLILAHQHTGQLKPETRGAAIANTGTKVIFQTTSDDARLIAREFGSSVKDVDLLNLGRHEAIARIATDAGTSPPVTIATRPPGRSTGNASKVRAASRANYGRARDDVEREIETRPQAVTAPPRRRPPVSGAGWV